MPAKRRRLPPTPEAALARACAGFLDCALPAGAVYTHIASGGDRNPIVAAKLKAEGVRRGAPDYVIAVPDVGVIFAELKTTAGKLSDHQQRWAEALVRTPGVTWGLIRSVDDLERLLLSAGVRLTASMIALRR